MTTSRSTKLAIVTGTTSGIGLELAAALLERGWSVLGLARRDAVVDRDGYTHLSVDLADLAALRQVAEQRLAPALRRDGLQCVALVNNAGLIGGLGWLQASDPQQLARLFAVNAVAPTYLMGVAVAAVAASTPLRIVNVSSGAAHSAYPGLGDYGATKAALRLAGRTLAAELAMSDRPPHAAAILSYEPGLVDTDMQRQAREASPASFPAHDVFQGFAEEGKLVEPRNVVGDIVEFLESDPDEGFTERRYGER